MPYVDVRLCLILLLVVTLNGGLINLALVAPPLHPHPVESVLGSLPWPFRCGSVA